MLASPPRVPAKKPASAPFHGPCLMMTPATSPATKGPISGRATPIIRLMRNPTPIANKRSPLVLGGESGLSLPIARSSSISKTLRTLSGYAARNLKETHMVTFRPPTSPENIERRNLRLGRNARSDRRPRVLLYQPNPHRSSLKTNRSGVSYQELLSARLRDRHRAANGAGNCPITGGRCP